MYVLIGKKILFTYTLWMMAENRAGYCMNIVKARLVLCLIYLYEDGDYEDLDEAWDEWEEGW